MQDAGSIIKSIWSVPKKPLASGAWLWWFWLFFIHDENTKKAGKCRQIMILWSVKNDRQISCNGLDISVPKSIIPSASGYVLDGAAAAWYFDGKSMRDNFVLERSKMRLDQKKLSLVAPGSTPSSFYFGKNGDFITKIKAKGTEFELIAKQVDKNDAVGPIHGRMPLFGSMEIEGTRLEILQLSGTQKTKGAPGNATGTKTSPIRGTAYFQKILLAAPPPQWYWGLYHFKDGSYLTYMNVYAGRAMLADNAYGKPELKKPTLGFKEDIFFYHAPSGKLFEGNRLRVIPSKSKTADCWVHGFSGLGKDFEISGVAEGYAHSSWSFVKNIGAIPIKSRFVYNEYPSVVKNVVLTQKGGKKLKYGLGWGSMENSWGFIV